MNKCDECGIAPAYEGGVFCTNCKPQTNADRIRAMTDEELADFFMELLLHCTNDLCNNCPLYDACFDIGVTDWLKREAEE